METKNGNRRIRRAVWNLQASGKGCGIDQTVRQRVVLKETILPVGAAVRVLIAPWGRVHSTKGDFLFDEAAAEMVLAAFDGHGTEIPVDYEHQSLGGIYAAPNGQAPAAGWIRRLMVVEPSDAEGGAAGLYGEVEWTAAAKRQLAAREYRYLSPVVIVRKRDRRVAALHSVALTNKPAIVGMRPIVNRQEVIVGDRADNREAEGQVQVAQRNDDLEPLPPAEPAKQDEMSMALQAEPGGKGESAGHHRDEAAVLDEALTQLRGRLSLDGNRPAAEVIAAAANRLGELMEAADRRAAEMRIEAAMQAGKLVPAQREWAMALALQDPAGFEAWMTSAPVVVRLGPLEAPATGPSGGPGREAVIASARRAYRADPELVQLTDESAWVNQALREAGLSVVN